jgi:nucleoside-diphosphate-sugar epimerase
MKVLITGASGFLGKSVLELLCADPNISSVMATSRSVRCHPHPKVQVVSCDLANPAAPLQIQNSNFDVVIHLAAQYNFGTDYQTNFLNNVVATQNLLHWLRADKKNRPRIIYASTYAVGVGVRDALRSETSLPELPPRNQPYARTKYLSEQLILESDFPTTALRLGILVGDRKKGVIEKLDGPYAILQMLYKLKKANILKFAPFMPIIARRNTVIPLVPVDCAAEIFHAVVMRTRQSSDKEIFGVYNPASISCGRFASAAMQLFGVQLPVKFLPEPPNFILNLQKHFTDIAPEMFDYVRNAPTLSNKNFEKCFPDLEIPDFSTYQETFFSGFLEFMGDQHGAA